MFSDLAHNFEKIINILQREFQKEINYKREEVHKIQKQLLKAQKSLHLLRYVVVKSFYESKEVKINTNEISVLPSTSSKPNLISNQQSRIHPAIKKLIGKKPLNYEPYRTRNKIIPNYGKVSKKHENITVKEENDTKEHTDNNLNEKHSLGLHQIIKTENHKDAMPIRNREKNKYNILIGNISKWMPSNSSQDNSTHKWMVYVRRPKTDHDITQIVKKVRFFLHPSYQPNDIVDVQ